jgi:hypothetical protein
MRNAYTVLVGKPEGKKHLGNLDVDGKIIIGPITAFFEHCDEPSGSVKARNFLTRRTSIHFSGKTLCHDLS